MFDRWVFLQVGFYELLKEPYETETFLNLGHLVLGINLYNYFLRLAPTLKISSDSA